MDKTKVLTFLQTDEGKKLLQPRLDRHFTKSLETWKQNSLPKLIEEHEKRKLTPDQRHEMELAKIKQELEHKKKMKALKIKSDETGLDAFTNTNELVKALATLEDEQAFKTIETLSEHFKSVLDRLVSVEVDSRFREMQYTPMLGDNSNLNNGLMTKEHILKMSYEERANLFTQNPDYYRHIMNS
ncbi:MAG: hypothetical protein PWQ06_1112 [Anaerophaga sp.]|jgi:hypothetical protein|nr:hypothetical protein [Anaerophaga sp.]